MPSKHQYFKSSLLQITTLDVEKRNTWPRACNAKLIAKSIRYTFGALRAHLTELQLEKAFDANKGDAISNIWSSPLRALSTSSERGLTSLNFRHPRRSLTPTGSKPQHNQSSQTNYITLTSAVTKQTLKPSQARISPRVTQIAEPTHAQSEGTEQTKDKMPGQRRTKHLPPKPKTLM